MDIPIRYEGRRGCGFRKPGGLYLISGRGGSPCGKLPLLLEVCGCCGQGIKQARGWTWISPARLFAGLECKGVDSCSPLCPANALPERAGLLWVGEKFYGNPTDFDAEAAIVGISRRISQIPRDFVLGKTWVFLAHRRAMVSLDPEKGEPVERPGVFKVFLPERIEYVVRGDETEEELQGLVDRGITPVKVVPVQGEMFPEGEGEPHEDDATE